MHGETGAVTNSQRQSPLSSEKRESETRLSPFFAKITCCIMKCNICLRRKYEIRIWEIYPGCNPILRYWRIVVDLDICPRNA